MAEKNAKEAVKTVASLKTPPPPPLSKRQKILAKLKKIFKIGGIIFLILILAAVGFAAGVYLKIIDLPTLSQRWKLHSIPFLGQHLPAAATNFETTDGGSGPADSPSSAAETPAASVASKPVLPEPTKELTKTVAEKGADAQPTTIKTIDPKELERQMKQRKQEEAKRIGKLARLYGGMKPEEAVAIMSQLDDDTVIAIFAKMDEEQVSRILALFEARRAARLTNVIFRGPDNAVLTSVN